MALHAAVRTGSAALPGSFLVQTGLLGLVLAERRMLVSLAPMPLRLDLGSVLAVAAPEYVSCSA